MTALRERGYVLLDARLWKRVHWCAPVALWDAREFKQAAWAIALCDRHREQCDAVADMVAAAEAAPHDPRHVELLELLVNMLLRFLARTAWRNMLRARRTGSRIRSVEDCDLVDVALLEVACDDQLGARRPIDEVNRILTRIIDATCEQPDPRIADALADAFRYVYGECPTPAGVPEPTHKHIAAMHGVRPGTLRSRISRMLKDIRLPPGVRRWRRPRSYP